MPALFKKEINQFFTSIIGYLTISVFLLVLGLFIWIFKGNTNIFDNGYATLEPLFYIAPWIFIFLIPAITMRMFSEEKKTGTLEILTTKPMTDWHIILAKFFAGITLVITAILPTLVYFYSVYQLANPIGNIDTGSTWGAYIGLILLGASFVAIGLFASAITTNQIIAFIVGVFLSFLFFTGFQSISSLEIFKPAEYIIQYIGIQFHYQSLSRGVIDSRDVIYYLSVIVFFILLTKTVLESRKW